MRIRSSSLIPASLFFAALGIGGAQNSAPSWHQWGGPDRNFRLESAQLATAWPASGPEQIWTRPLGDGYSAIVVDGSALYTMYRQGDDEIVVALDAGSGETRWEHSYRAPILDDGNFGFWMNSAGPGPYATPLLVGSRLFTVGVNGELHALDKTTGKVLWFHNLVEEYSLSGYSGFASSPIAYGDNVILPVGGRGQGVMAFDRESGQVAWKRQDFALAPASPILVDVDGEEQLIVFAAQQVAGLDPRNGDLVLGSSGDFGPAFFTAFDIHTGEEVWRERTFGRSHMVYAGGQLVIVDEDGEIALATATREGLQVHARAAALTENAWTPPTLVGTTLYVRDRKNILALDLGG